MEYLGVGTVTGIYGIKEVKNAIIVDSKKAFDNIKRGIERITGEREGLSGIRSIVGRQSGVTLVLVHIPPYPEAIVEVVTELYIFGVRKIISIGRSYTLEKKLPARPVIVATSAIGLDSISRAIAGPDLPLIPSPTMEYMFKNVAELRFVDFNWVYANTITIPSIASRPHMEMVKKLTGKRWVTSVDSVSAPLYALQYEYTRLEALSLLVVAAHIDQVSTTSIVRSMDEMNALSESVARDETILYMVAVEMLKRMGDREE